MVWRLVPELYLKWSVKNFRADRGLKQLRRDFIHQHKINKHKIALYPYQFGRVISRFEGSGGVGDNRTNNRRNSLSEDKTHKIEEHFVSNPKSSPRQASIDLRLPRSTLQRTLTKKLKFKPYRYMPV